MAPDGCSVGCFLVELWLWALGGLVRTRAGSEGNTGRALTVDAASGVLWCEGLVKMTVGHSLVVL